MAMQSSVNQSVANGADAMFRFKALLLLLGYTVRSSGDGTTFFAASDGITHAGSGAGGMNNSRAWFCVRAPVVVGQPRREFCFQRGSVGEANWWMKVSAEDGFTLTPGDLDDMPTALDEQNLHGTTTAGTVFFGAAGTYRAHIVGDDALGWFYMFTATNGTGAPLTCMLLDLMVTGSYPSADVDPAIYHFNASNPFTTGVIQAASVGPWGWWSKNLGGEAFVHNKGFGYKDSGGTQGIPGNIGSNPYNGRDNHFPIPYGRDVPFGSSVGWKGFGSVMRWRGVSRPNLDTLSVAAVITRVYVGDCVLPYPNVAPIV